MSSDLSAIKSTVAAGSGSSMKPTKVVIPKVWKRPHSTIYGKNVEFGSKLTSDKLGEINGRKFNSELPWQVRNSGSSSLSTSSSSNQGYLSKLLNEPQSTLIGSVIRGSPTTTTTSSYGCGYNYGGGSGSGGDGSDKFVINSSSSSSSNNSSSSLMTRAEDRINQLNAASCSNYADVLEVTNPNRYSKRRRDNLILRNSRMPLIQGKEAKQKRIDFFENYLNFSNEINRLSESSRLANDPLLHKREFDKNLDFDYELGLFVPSSSSSSDRDERSLARKRTLQRYEQQLEAGHVAAAVPHLKHSDPVAQKRYNESDDSIDQSEHRYHNHACDELSDINNSKYLFNPVVTTTQQTNLLPRHDCQLSSSPYGQSADGRKLSLGSINPHSYRPSLPHKTSTLHASDGEEFEFQDRSSPFYTDRWAGKTIRHFDSDLYSNANLFKSMIL